MKVQHLLEAANIPVTELRDAIKRDKLVSWMLRRDSETQGPPEGMNNYAEQFRRIRHLVIDNHHVRELFKGLNYSNPYPYDRVRKEKPEEADEHTLMRAAQVVKNVMLAVRDSERRYLYGYGKRDMEQYAQAFEDYATHLALPVTYNGFPGKPNARKNPVPVYALVELGSDQLIGAYHEIDTAIRLGNPLRSPDFKQFSMWRESREAVIAAAIEASKKYRSVKKNVRHAVISTLAAPDDVVVSSHELPEDIVQPHNLGAGYILRPGKRRIRYIGAFANGEKTDVFINREVDTDSIDDILTNIEMIVPKLIKKLSGVRDVVFSKSPATFIGPYELSNVILRCTVSPDQAAEVDSKFLVQVNALLNPLIEHALEAGSDMHTLFAHNKMLHDFVVSANTYKNSKLGTDTGAVASFYNGDVDSAVQQFSTFVKNQLTQGSLYKIWVYEKRQTNSMDIEQVASWGFHTGGRLNTAGIAVQKEVASKVIGVMAKACKISDVPSVDDSIEDKRKFFIDVLVPQVADLVARVQIGGWMVNVVERLKSAVTE